jgi:hypothetical protein
MISSRRILHAGWSEDQPPLAVTIGLLGLGIYLIVRSLILSPGLSYSLILVPPGQPESKQVVTESLTADGVDVSDPKVAQDIASLADAVRGLRTAWPSVLSSLDAVLSHARPRGHRDAILNAVARDVHLSPASLRRRRTQYSTNSSSVAAPGLFERLRSAWKPDYDEEPES